MLFHKTIIGKHFLLVDLGPSLRRSAECIQKDILPLRVNKTPEEAVSLPQAQTINIVSSLSNNYMAALYHWSTMTTIPDLENFAFGPTDGY